MGSLKGRRAGEALGNPVDFREQVGVYVLYDDNFRVVYVGQAGAGNQTLLGRLKQHRKALTQRQCDSSDTKIRGRCLVGWCQVTDCSFNGNVARCRGWTNSGANGDVSMTVRWRSPVSSK